MKTLPKRRRHCFYSVVSARVLCRHCGLYVSSDRSHEHQLEVCPGRERRSNTDRRLNADTGGKAPPKKVKHKFRYVKGPNDSADDNGYICKGCGIVLTDVPAFFIEVCPGRERRTGTDRRGS